MSGNYIAFDQSGGYTNVNECSLQRKVIITEAYTDLISSTMTEQSAYLELHSVQS